MTEQKRRHKTTIAGRPYTIIASKTPEHLQAVADLVEEQISQIQKAMPVLDVEQRSVLVAVNAVSQSLDRQQEVDQLKEQIAELEKEREDLLRELHTYEDLLDELTPDEAAEEAAGEPDNVWITGRHLASEDKLAESSGNSDSENLEAPSFPIQKDEAVTQQKPAAKKANLRFVRPTTASQAFLQHVETKESQDQPKRVGDGLSRTRRKQNNNTDHGE